jgi:hypothetical protein
MSDDEATTTAPDGGTGPGPDAPDRLDRLEDKVGKLAEAVAALVPGTHAEAQDHTEDRLDRPSSVEEQVAHALAQARADDAKHEREAALHGDVQTVKDDLAKLREKPPAAPVPRRERLLGWSR